MSVARVQRTWSRHAAVVLTAVTAVVAGACGPKVDPSSIVTASTTPRGAEPASSEEVLSAAGAEGPAFDAAAAAGPVHSGGRDTAPAVAGSGTERTVAADAAPAPAAAPGPEEAGERFAPGVTDTTIRIGMHLPLSVSGLDLRSLVPLDEAVNAYWASRNREGGIHGRKIEVFIGDDGYSPSGAVQACKTLVERNDVFFVYGGPGADQNLACGQYTMGQGRPYLSIGGVEKGLVGNPNYWAVTGTYEPESALLAEYAVAELGGRERPLAMLRVNSPNTESARRGFVTRAKELGAKVAVDESVDKDPNPSQLQATCIKMQQAGVEIVYMLASGLVMAQAADACTSQGYRPQWLGRATGGACGITAPLGSESLDGCIAFSATHHPADTDSPLEHQAKKDWEATYPGEAFPGDVDPLTMLVWAMCDVLREALERTGPDLHVGSFNNTMAGFVYDNGLFNPLDFRGGSHVGTGAVVLWRGDAAAGRHVEIDSTWRDDFGL